MKNTERIANMEIVMERIETLEKELQDLKKNLENLQAAEKTEKVAIEEMDLSVHAYTCLKRAGINTIEELTALPESELKKIKKLGTKTFEEIRRKVKIIENTRSLETLRQKAERKKQQEEGVGEEIKEESKMLIPALETYEKLRKAAKDEGVFFNTFGGGFTKLYSAYKRHNEVQFTSYFIDIVSDCHEGLRPAMSELISCEQQNTDVLALIKAAVAEDVSLWLEKDEVDEKSKTYCHAKKFMTIVEEYSE